MQANRQVSRSDSKSRLSLALYTRLAVLIALAAVGAMIRIPSPTGTVALDAAPGFLAAFLFGPGPGAIVSSLGHLASAGMVAFPLGLPMHLFIALQMAVVAMLIGYTNQRVHTIAAVVVGIIANGIGAPATFVLMPSFGVSFFLAMVGPLLLASTVNVVAASLLYRALQRFITVGPR
ncbi:MAG: ECF transporter S component [Firmicutes bacterium]|nr:ECF transporter S component [Bacillota bacterium]